MPARRIPPTELHDLLFPMTRGSFRERCFVALRVMLGALVLGVAFYVFSVVWLLGE